MKHYSIKENKISVIYCGWQHVNRINESKDIFDKYPDIKQGSYYFAMSSAMKNKNFSWVLKTAKNMPDEIFVIAGSGLLKMVNEKELSLMPNVRYLGYVSDEEAKGLLKNCKAFLFPSLYEGFGLPPLEAIACGAKRVLVSDIPCMREIYGDSVEYISLDKFIIENSQRHGQPCEAVLAKYQWEKSGGKLKSLLSFIGENN